MRKTNHIERKMLSTEYIKKIIDKAAENNFQAISFTGGEPMLHYKELIELLKYSTEKNIKYIRTGTNGFIFMESDSPKFIDKVKKIAEDISNTNLRNFWISVDSADIEVHENMRGLKGVIKGIEKALPIFHEYGIYPSVNLGINRNIGGLNKKLYEDNNSSEYIYEKFQKSFSKFYDFVINMGFTIANACYPMSVEENEKLSKVYEASASDKIVNFKNYEKLEIFKALFDTIPLYREKIKIFTPRTALYSLIKQYNGEENYPYSCRGGYDFYFIDSVTGDTYPCGYRGNENFGKFWDIDFKNVRMKYCRKCDWECFTDPSELLGPVVDIFKKPFKTINKIVLDKEYSKLWKEDIKYYKKSDYFNERKK